MRISSLNTSTTAYTYSSAPSASDKLDSISNLYKIDLKKINKRDLSAVAGEPELENAFVYARGGINSTKPLSTSAVVLENADGTLFTLDTSTANTKVNLVAKGKSIELYVYNPADADTEQPSNVQKYTFDSTGKLDANAPVTELSAWEVSDAEIKTKRDLDNNGTDGNGKVQTDRLGGKLAVRTAVTASDKAAARKEASAGIFKLEVLDQQLFVVGETLEKSKQINAKDQTLLNSDGTAAWKPDATYDTYRAVKTNSGWDVYASKTTSGTTEVTQFKFGANLRINESATKLLSDDEMAAAEVSNKRDLNVDGFYGAEVSKAIDKKGGLYEAKFQGATVYLAQTGLKSDKTGASPVSLKGELVDGQGKAWAGPATGFTVTAIVDSATVDSAATSDYTVFAKNGSDVRKYTFTSNGLTGNDLRYSLDTASAAGLTATAVEMAAAEKAAARDLTDDSKYGADITSTTDQAGGLYKASMLGKDFFVVGSGLKTASTGSLANDLSHALLATDGSAWKVKSGYTVATVVQTATIGTNSATTNKFTVYAYKGDAAANPAVAVDKDDVLRYEFESDTDGNNLTVTESDIKVTAQYLSEQEKTLARDLNKDTKLGATLTTTALDTQGGLYKATLFGQDYVVKSTAGQSVVDLSHAFMQDDGVTAWEPKAADGTAISLATGTFRLVMGDAQTSNSADATIYVSTGTGATSKYLKFDFEEVTSNSVVTGYKQIGNATVLSAEEMAAAEKANNSQSVDLNGDGSYGVVISEALDQRGGLFKGSLGDKTDIFFKEANTLVPGSKIAADAEDFSTALTDDTGYWSIATAGKTVKAYDDGSNYFVFASDNTDKTKITQYKFGSDNKLVEEKDISLDELVDIEANDAERDLNADGIVGVRVSTVVPDSQGGLFTVSAGGTDYLVADSAAANITDLSKALRKTDGTAWAAPDGTTRMVIDQQGNDYKVYAKTASAVKEFTFDSDYKIQDAQTRTLTDFELADAEIAADGGDGRDINGDGVIGARITKELTKTADFTLSEASLGSGSFVVVKPGTSTDNTTALTDIALRKANGTAWTLADAKANATDTVTVIGAETSKNGTDLSKTTVYVKLTTAGASPTTTGKSLTFGSDGKLLGTETLDTDAEVNALSETLKAAYMTGSYEDKTGGLYKASILGKTIYAVGNSGTNPNAPADLSKALMVGAGATATAWAPASGDNIGGMVTNVDGNNAVTGYDVYTYSGTAGLTETAVFKASWDADLNYLGTVKVDAANLVKVETDFKRDLNKDTAFGFGVDATATAASTHKGVSVVKVGGDTMTFLVAGTNLTPGSGLAPLGLKDALLNEEGSAWTPDTGFSITAVDETTDASNRLVYASKTASGVTSYMKYEFSNTDGKLTGPGTSLTAIEMAAEEVTNTKDDDGDGYIGLGNISTLRVASGNYTQGKPTGLLKANLGTTDFLVYDSAWTTGDSLDLSNALLKADGTAWSAPGTFEIRGVYENADDELEVYGYDTTANKTQMYKFAQSVDAFGTASGAYTLMTASVGGSATGANSITDADLAKAEYAAGANGQDLNADGAIGYKALATPTLRETDSTQTLGKAALGTSEIYFVSTDYAGAVADTTGADVSTGALYMDATGNGDLVYWKPTTSEPNVSYSIKSIVENAGDVEVWALRTDSSAANDITKEGFVKFTFSGTGSNGEWVLDSSTFNTDVTTPNILSYEQIIANESGIDSVAGSTADTTYTGKDLNGDGVIGVKLDALEASGLGSNIYSTTIKMDDGSGNYADTTFYMVGSNLASGNSSNPLGLDATKVIVDGTGSTTPWAPTGTLTNWKVLDPVTAATETATHSVDDAGTTVYINVTSTEIYKV